MKMRLKMKNISHAYDINRPTSRHGHKYRKHKMCLSLMMIICIKQRLSNILSPATVRLSRKKALLIKKRVFQLFPTYLFLFIYFNPLTAGVR